MNIKKTNSAGVSHLLVLLLVIVVCAVGGTYMLVSSRAEQATTASKRTYYYQKPTKAQLNKLKRIAGHYWGGICNDGKNIKVAYYWGTIRIPDVTNPYDININAFTYDVDTAAYVKPQSARYPKSTDYCTIHVNEYAVSGVMNKGMPFSTKRYMCFILAHETGHIFGYGDYKKNADVNKEVFRLYKHKDSRILIMSYYYGDFGLWGAKYSWAKDTGPRECHKIR